MTRFFVRPEQIVDGRALLGADDAHHLRIVLRAMPGARISVLDDTGREYPGVLEEVGKTRATARLEEPVEPGTEPSVRITVAQALPKTAEKMEQVIQRGTEAGATGFWAFASERSLTHLDGERQEKRRQRWQAIAKTAAEQAHRARLPTLTVEGSLPDVLAAAPSFDLTLLASAVERERTLRAVLDACRPRPRAALVVVGPEGGFTDCEVATARRAGAYPVSLGPRILRTETAALVLLAQILFALE